MTPTGRTVPVVSTTIELSTFHGLWFGIGLLVVMSLTTL
jgi:hypothetical protein